MAAITRSTNSGACATPSATGPETATRSTRSGSYASRRTPSREDWKSSVSRTAIRIILRSRRVSTPSTPGPSIATSSLRCRREACARPARGGWTRAACSRKSRLLKRLDHHHVDDHQRDHRADDAIKPRLSFQAPVGGPGRTFAVGHLDLLSGRSRVKADRDHDQGDEENQPRHHPTLPPPWHATQPRPSYHARP